MGQTLVVRIADDAYEVLKEVAQREGRSAEATGAEWLEGTARYFMDDPLEKHIGAYRSNVPGWSLRHHECLGIMEALATDHHFEPAGFVQLLK